jgi:hypothetical protein
MTCLYVPEWTYQQCIETAASINAVLASALTFWRSLQMIWASHTIFIESKTANGEPKQYV